MPSNDDYYKFLDVSPTASAEEIRSAFRRMAFKYHPDHNKDPWAETIFKQINEAYQVLSDPNRRTAYDAERRAQAQRAEESQRAARERHYYRERAGASGSGYEGRNNKAGAATPAIPNYLSNAILATLFCFWPAGIVSIVFAARVNGKIKKGDIQGALKCSRRAKIWAWVSFGLGIPLVLSFFSIFGILMNITGFLTD